MDIQCEATVKSTGIRCSYKGKFVDTKTKKHYCGHHYQKPKTPVWQPRLSPPPPPSQRDNEPKRPETKAVVSQTPWISLGLPTPSPELRLITLRKLRNRINRGPRNKSNDGGGHLYVYSLAHEDGRDYWKIGMTKRSNLDNRMKEWRSKHVGHTVVLKKSYAINDSATVKHLERVVHLYLDHKRMYRYFVPNGIVSVWAATRQEIDDEDRRVWNASKSRPDERPSAKGKMIEWFCLPWEEELSPLLEALVKYYSALAPSAL